MSRRYIPLLAVLAAVLFVGATSIMDPDVYRTWWWFTFWTAVAAGMTVSLFSVRLRHDPPLWLLHASLLIILVGGGVTALMGRSADIRLSPGDRVTEISDHSGEIMMLPEEICLQRFYVEHYPGMKFARDYHSELSTASGKTMHISMNRIGKLRNRGCLLDEYRFYQFSYDGTEGTTVLKVVHDPWGIMLSYTGYLMFAAGGIWLLISRLWRRQRKMPAKAVVLLPALLCALSGAATPHIVSMQEADSMKMTPVVFGGRVVPYASMARSVTLSLCDRTSIDSLDAVRFILSFESNPEEWRTYPFLSVRSRELREDLGADDNGFVAPSSLFATDGTYIPELYWQGGDGKQDKAILDLDEKTSVLASMIAGDLYTIPSAREAASLPVWRSHAIVSYENVGPIRIFFILAFVCATAIFIISAKSTSLTGRLAFRAAVATASVGLLIFLWNWVAYGEAPLVATSQILFFTAVTLSIATVFTSRKFPVPSACALTACGAIAAVAWIGSRTPQLTPVMPVLNSPWLSLHVSLAMTSYSLLGFTSICALWGILHKPSRKRLARLCLTLDLVGTIILGMGIWTGALWANVSWGRYWAWDPKETWALVTMLLYAIPLHRAMNLRTRPLPLFIYLLLASSAIAMTFFGVNLLPSLHAYR